MALTGYDERHRGAVGQALEFARTTLIGGALFLLPFFVVIFVLERVLGLLTDLTEPLVSALDIHSFGGIAISNLVTVLAVVLLAFAAGLFARTKSGQRAMTWVREGVAAAIPQFSLIHDVARNVSSEDEVADMPVVLVPVESGWAVGLLLESEGDWHAVFIPDAPVMSSGSVAYAHTDHIHRTDLTLTQLWTMLRARGKGSSKVYQRLAVLQADGKVT